MIDKEEEKIDRKIKGEMRGRLKEDNTQMKGRKEKKGREGEGGRGGKIHKRKEKKGRGEEEEEYTGGSLRREVRGVRRKGEVGRGRRARL